MRHMKINLLIVFILFNILIPIKSSAEVLNNAKFEKVAVTPAPKNPPVVGTEDPTQPGKKPQVANNKALPKTANSMNIELYTFLMILSAGLFVVAFKRKKES